LSEFLPQKLNARNIIGNMAVEREGKIFMFHDDLSAKLGP
jgi:hypothetical protein